MLDACRLAEKNAGSWYEKKIDCRCMHHKTDIIDCDCNSFSKLQECASTFGRAEHFDILIIRYGGVVGYAR